MTGVPSQYQPLVNNAAAQLGIPASVVAAQIQTESNWNPNAVSPTGAQGLAQFEPATWASYGSGSPNDPTAAFNAYVKYMSVLLQQFGGNVRNALAAYNAGPGNLSAGYGYADGIISQSGSGVTTATGGIGTGSTAQSGTQSIPQTSQTVATGSGSTCAFALGTKSKVLVWNVNLSICIISKTELRALIGALMLASGGVVLMVGAGLVLEYALDKTGVSKAASSLPGIPHLGGRSLGMGGA